MAYSESKNLLFIHIPKNAGTSIINTLALKPHGHFTWNEHPPTPTDARSFAVIRNPWDRFVSCYEFAKMKKSYWHSIAGSSIWGEHPDYDLCNSLPFTDFVNQFAAGHLTIEHSGWGPQYQYVCDRDGSVKVDKLLKCENISSELNEFLEDCGLETVELPRDNSSRPADKSYKDYYTQETAHKVGQLYCTDIALFDYEF